MKRKSAKGIYKIPVNKNLSYQVQHLNQISAMRSTGVKEKNFMVTKNSAVDKTRGSMTIQGKIQLQMVPL